MPKAPVLPIQNLTNEQSALGRMNQNFEVLSEAIEDQLSRSGEAPNEMLADLDMNDYRVLNLPPPVTPTEPARHGDIQQYVDQAEAAAERAEEAADEAEAFRDETEGFRDETEDLLHEFQGQYLGAHAEDPTEDENGNPLQVGALYFNTTTQQFKAYAEPLVMVLDDTVMVLDEPVIIALWVVIPMTSLLSLTDVDPDGLAHRTILRWNDGTGYFELVPLSADNVSYDNSVSNLDAETVRDALDEIVNRATINSYDISLFFEGLPDNFGYVFRLVTGRSFYLPVNLVGSQGSADTAANDTHDWLIRKNGTPVGTITWTTAVAEPTFTLAGDTVFNEGDILDIVVDGPADTTLRDISLLIRAWRP